MVVPSARRTFAQDVSIMRPSLTLVLKSAHSAFDSNTNFRTSWRYLGSGYNSANTSRSCPSTSSRGHPKVRSHSWLASLILPSGLTNPTITGTLSNILCRISFCLLKSSSALLRSSISIDNPYHLTRFPCSSRSGAVRTKNQRRSEEHTSELQSPCNLVCRLLLEK